MTHGKIHNKSPLRTNHKATRSKANTGTTALEQSVEQTTKSQKLRNKLHNSPISRCILNLVLLNPHMPFLCKQCRSRSVAFNRSGSAVFVIKYVNLYQQPGSSILIGWKLEPGGVLRIARVKYVSNWNNIVKLLSVQVCFLQQKTELSIDIFCFKNTVK